MGLLERHGVDRCSRIIESRARFLTIREGEKDGKVSHE